MLFHLISPGTNSLNRHAYKCNLFCGPLDSDPVCHLVTTLWHWLQQEFSQISKNQKATEILNMINMHCIHEMKTKGHKYVIGRDQVIETMHAPSS